MAAWASSRSRRLNILVTGRAKRIILVATLFTGVTGGVAAYLLVPPLPDVRLSISEIEAQLDPRFRPALLQEPSEGNLDLVVNTLPPLLEFESQTDAHLNHQRAIELSKHWEKTTVLLNALDWKIIRPGIQFRAPMDLIARSISVATAAFSDLVQAKDFERAGKIITSLSRLSFLLHRVCIGSNAALMSEGFRQSIRRTHARFITDDRVTAKVLNATHWDEYSPEEIESQRLHYAKSRLWNFIYAMRSRADQTTTYRQVQYHEPDTISWLNTLGLECVDVDLTPGNPPIFPGNARLKQIVEDQKIGLDGVRPNSDRRLVRILVRREKRRTPNYFGLAFASTFAPFDSSWREQKSHLRLTQLLLAARKIFDATRKWPSEAALKRAKLLPEDPFSTETLHWEQESLTAWGRSSPYVVGTQVQSEDRITIGGTLTGYVYSSQPVLSIPTFNGAPLLSAPPQRSRK